MGNRVKKIFLIISAGFSAVLFFLSVSTLYVETDMFDSGFCTLWFQWHVDAAGIYFLTAVLCLVTARLGMAVFYPGKEDNVEALMEG